MADLFDSIENLARSFQERLTVRTVYGEPVTANGVTVIPVAKVRFGFGGGGGSGTGTKPAAAGEAGGMEAAEAAVEAGARSGGGGAGGGMVQPMGFIEICDGGARWVPLEPPRAELALRALMAVAVIAPGGGRRGFLRRLFLALSGQALIGALFRPKLPPLPEGLRFGRRAVDEAA